jgi:hypothetical protein
MAKTVHVIPTQDGWVVAREGKTPIVFPTKKAAVAQARTLAKKGASGQFIVHGVDGGIAARGSYGLPRTQQLPYKSNLGTKNIEKAVLKVVRERLMSA